MKVLLLEDESLAAERLTNLLTGIDSSIVLVAQLKSIAASVQWLNENSHPDLIVADIRLLDGLCFEIFQQVPVHAPVIFTTAYDQYAIKAFEVNSIDYLLKPVQEDKLRKALYKVNLTQDKPPAVDYAEILSHLQATQKKYKSRFMVRLGQKILAITVEKIAYFYSENKLSFLVTHDHKRYPLDQPLDELMELLDPHLFFRANRQCIITFSSIAEIHPYFKGRVKLLLNPATTEEVIISSERSPEFKKWIDQ